MANKKNCLGIPGMLVIMVSFVVAGCATIKLDDITFTPTINIEEIGIVPINTAIGRFNFNGSVYGVSEWRFDLVAGDGDTGNSWFRIENGNRLVTAWPLEAGVYSIRVNTRGETQPVGQGVKRTFTITVGEAIATAATAAAAPVAEAPVTENDFAIKQNAQGGITITGYTGKAKRVAIPATISGLKVTAIGNGAFSGKGLTSVTIPNGVQTIGYRAFNSNSLGNLVIPDSVTSIGASAFAGGGITTLTLGKGITTIGGNAFTGNAFEELTIPDSVIEIDSGEYEFDMPRVSSDNKGAFEDCGIKTLKLGKGLITIGAKAFADNQISEITLGNKLVTIGIQAFEGNQLRELTLPASLKTIGAGAFRNNQLTALVIPNGVTLIGYADYSRIDYGAFSGNPLASLTIPSSLASYSNTVRFADGFKSCPLTRITLPANVDEANVRQFGEGFVNFWKLQNKRAGTYVLNNRIWSVQ